jgi:hypothetical protein
MKNKRLTMRLAAFVMAVALMMTTASALAQSDIEEQGFRSVDLSWYENAQNVLGAVMDGVFEDYDSQDEEQGLLRNAWNKIKKITKDAANKTRDFAVDTYNKAKDVATDSYEKTKDFATDTYNLAVEGTKSAWETVKETTKTVANAIYEEDEEQGFIRDTWRKTKEFAKKAGNAIWEETDVALDNGFSAISGQDLEEQGMLDNIWRGIKDTMTMINPINYIIP